MAKKEVFDNKITGPIMRSLRHIEVDRHSGAASFDEACRNLAAGEFVGVYPEATISRSFELKEFRSGAARMAMDAKVPIVPMIVWGAQRIWTKDHPKRLGYNKFPITVSVGAPMAAAGTVESVMDELRSVMNGLLYRVQEEYEHPAGAHWVPRRLGGSAPTPEEARALEVAELAERARRRAGGG
jgi:1-acyl-sn-glycerol-3-phosphate acyltransferase